MFTLEATLKKKSKQQGSIMIKSIITGILACALFSGCQQLKCPVSGQQAELDTNKPWSLVVLPDTQYYSRKFPEMFTTQTKWIVEQHEEQNIKYVLHLGDITDHNTDLEWTRAKKSMNYLDQAKIPYVLAVGNHDMGVKGRSKTRDTKLNSYFKHSEQAAWPTFGGAMEKDSLNNTYHLFEAGGKQWIVISLEWAPTDKIVNWANSVMAEHSNRLAILVTHAYMNNNDHRYNIKDKKNSQRYNPHTYQTPGDKNDGEQLWHKLVKKYRFVFTLNGHVLGDGTGYKKSMTDRGNVCHQILTNYQMRPKGGEAFLKIMNFDSDGETVRIRAYSPHLKQYLDTKDQSFDVKIPQQ